MKSPSWWTQPGVGRADFRKPRAAPEKDLDAAVMRYLRLRRWHVTRLQQARRSKIAPGVPDLWIMAPHRGGYWIELKAPGNTPSRTQAAWHLMARAAGVRVLVVHSAAELAAALEEA